MRSPSVKSALSDNESIKRSQAALSDNFGAQMKKALEAQGRDMAWLHSQTGIATSTLSDYGKGKLPRIDKAAAIAGALGVSLDKMLSTQRLSSVSVADADKAEWIEVLEFSLKAVNDEGLGEPISATSIRRDWLYNALGETKGVWITKMLAPYPAASLGEGAAIFCKNVSKGEMLVDKGLYLFRINGGLVVSRFSFREAGIMLAGDALGEDYVSFDQIGTDDDKLTPVARIIGVLARPI